MANDMLRDLQEDTEAPLANVDQLVLDGTWNSVTHLVTVASEVHSSAFDIRRLMIIDKTQ